MRITYRQDKPCTVTQFLHGLTVGDCTTEIIVNAKHYGECHFNSTIRKAIRTLILLECLTMRNTNAEGFIFLTVKIRTRGGTFVKSIPVQPSSGGICDGLNNIIVDYYGQGLGK
jgi:hypothetical protein